MIPIKKIHDVALLGGRLCMLSGAFVAVGGFLLLLALAGCAKGSAADRDDLSTFVDPMIGTDFTGNT